MYYYLLWKFFLLLKSSFIKSFLLWNQRISLTADTETAWLYFRSVRIFYSHNFVNFWLLWEKKKTRSFGSCEKLWQLKCQKPYSGEKEKWNEKTMRHIELSVQQKCTLFLFVIAAIHVGGLIWILVSEDL